MVPKSQWNPCERSASTSEKMMGCPALLKPLLSLSLQTQFRKEEPLHSQPSAALGRKGLEAVKCERKGGGLTRTSASDPCQVTILHDYNGSITAVPFFLPSVRCLYLCFDSFRETLNFRYTEKPGIWLAFLRLQVHPWAIWTIFICCLGFN